MRRIFFVIGAESSGTRMLTKSFTSVGVFGSAEHRQRLDGLNFNNIPEDIQNAVFRRSVPHAKMWPPLAGLYNLMKASGFDPVPIVIEREEKYVALSQVAAGHVENLEDAKAQIHFAKQHIDSEMGKLGISPALVNYERFVTDGKARERFFEQYGLREPDIDYYNANEKYEVTFA